MTLQMILHDGTAIDLLEAGLSKHYVVHCDTEDDFVALWKQFTPENLTEVKISEDDTVTQTIEGMTLDGVQTVTNEDGSITGHFYLSGGTYKADEYSEAGKILLGDDGEGSEVTEG